MITMTAAGTQTSGGSLYSLVFMVVAVVFLYFIMVRPQKKKEKADAEMRKNLQVGDEIETIGGIVGIVTKIEKDTLIIETSSDRCKMRIKKWAVSTNVTADEDMKAKAADAKAAKTDKKAKKDEDKPIEKD